MSDTFCHFKQYVISYTDESGLKKLTTIDGNYINYFNTLSNMISDSPIMMDEDVSSNVIDIPISGLNEDGIQFASKFN